MILRGFPMTENNKSLFLKNYFVDYQMLEKILKKKLKKYLRVMFFDVFLQSQTKRVVVKLSLDVL